MSPKAKSRKKVAIYGASAGGKTLKECLELIGGYEVACFLDDDPAKVSFESLPVMRGTDLPKLREEGIQAVACEIADSAFRIGLRERLKSLGLEYLTVVHPTASLSPSAKVGVGCFIKAGAVIETNTAIGDCCIVDNGVNIPHDNRIGDGCHLAPGVSLGSSILIGEGSIIGIGASIATGVKVGRKVIVSVGTSVVTDVPDNAVVEGVPGRIIGQRK